MSQTVKHQLWIVLATAPVLFTNLGVPRLWDEDEPRNAACAREMMARGDWITPTFNGQLRTDKPILLYWLMHGSYTLFGPTEFGARFWSAVLAVGTALCTYHLGRILFRAEAGLWAGLAIGTALMFDVAGRAATPDSTLIFCTTLSLTLFVRGAFREQQSDSVRSDASSARSNASSLAPSRFMDFVLMYAAMGLAVLAKGPVGLVLPCGIIGLYLMWLSGGPKATDPRPQNALGWYDAVFAFLRRMLSPRAFAHALWAMRPLTLLVVVAAVALPWYIAVGVRTDGEWLQGFLWKHNLERFSGAMEGHRGGVWYYVPAILVGFFPWSVFLPLTLLGAARRIAGHHEWRRGYVFLACWAGLYLTLFSLAATKLPSYVLPAYPALALLVGAFLDHAVSSPAAVSRGWMRLAFGTLAAVGIGFLMIFLLDWPVDLSSKLPGEQLLGLVGIPLILGGVAAIVFWEQNRLRQAMAAVAMAAVLFQTGIFGVASVRVSQYQNGAPLAGYIRQAGGAEARVATFAYLPSSLVYYAGQVEVCRQPYEVRQFFESEGPAYLVTLFESLDQLQFALPPDVKILDRQPRFLKSGEEVVLLGRKPEGTTAQAAGSDVKRAAGFTPAHVPVSIQR